MTRRGAKLAKRETIQCQRSLGLIAEGIRTKALPEPGAVTIVDLLRDSEAYFPTDGAGFIAWAREEGFLD